MSVPSVPIPLSVDDRAALDNARAAFSSAVLAYSQARHVMARVAGGGRDVAIEDLAAARADWLEAFDALQAAELRVDVALGADDGPARH